MSHPSESFLPGIHRAFVDANHYASLIHWAYPLDSPDDDDTIMDCIPPVCPVDFPIADHPHLEDALLPSPIPNVPITLIISMQPYGNPPPQSPLALSMADLGANLCITNAPQSWLTSAQSHQSHLGLPSHIPTHHLLCVHNKDTFPFSCAMEHITTNHFF